MTILINKKQLVANDVWVAIDWANHHAKVYTLQHEIFKSSLYKEIKLMHSLQAQLIRLEESKLLAVKQMTQDNRRKKTAGVDSKVSLTYVDRFNLVRSLRVNSRVSPIRRVFNFIPGKFEKQSLEIPTVRDRAKQALVLMALEPQWEAEFSQLDWHSFGFRPGRNVNDARKAIARWIWKPRYVLDATISNCFVRINHNYLLAKLNCTGEMKFQINAWLKAGVMGRFSLDYAESLNERGTLQGEIISPLLANIALCGMYQAIVPLGTRTPRIGFVRYAANFVIICNSKLAAAEYKVKLKQFFGNIGLKFSEERTRIIDSSIGFDFMGFHFKTYECSFHHASLPRINKRKKDLPFLRSAGLPFRGTSYTTIPSRKSVLKYQKSIIVYLRKNIAGTPQSKIIKDLGQIIRRWTNYFAPSNAIRIFSYMDKWLYTRLMKLAAKRCKGSRRRAFAKYFISVGSRKWNFGYKSLDGKPIYLHRHDAMQTGAIICQVKRDASPYNGRMLYWAKRLSNTNRLSKWARLLVIKQEYKCGYCMYFFQPKDIIEVHHKLEKSKGGTFVKENIMAVHSYCHIRIHRKS